MWLSQSLVSADASDNGACFCIHIHLVLTQYFCSAGEPVPSSAGNKVAAEWGDDVWTLLDRKRNPVRSDKASGLTSGLQARVDIKEGVETKEPAYKDGRQSAGLLIKNRSISEPFEPDSPSLLNPSACTADRNF